MPVMRIWCYMPAHVGTECNKYHEDELWLNETQRRVINNNNIYKVDHLKAKTKSMVTRKGFGGLPFYI